MDSSVISDDIIEKIREEVYNIAVSYEDEYILDLIVEDMQKCMTDTEVRDILFRIFRWAYK